MGYLYFAIRIRQKALQFVRFSRVNIHWPVPDAEMENEGTQLSLQESATHSFEAKSDLTW